MQPASKDTRLAHAQFGRGPESSWRRQKKGEGQRDRSRRLGGDLACATRHRQWRRRALRPSYWASLLTSLFGLSCSKGSTSLLLADLLTQDSRRCSAIFRHRGLHIDCTNPAITHIQRSGSNQDDFPYCLRSRADRLGIEQCGARSGLLFALTSSCSRQY